MKQPRLSAATIRAAEVADEREQDIVEARSRRLLILQLAIGAVRPGENVMELAERFRRFAEGETLH